MGCMKFFRSHVSAVRFVVYCSVMVALQLAGSLRAAPVISEIMYNSPGADLDWLEIANSGDAAVDLTRWQLSEGVTFDFPEGATLAPGAAVVVCESVEAFRAAYPDVPAETILGEFTGRLANGGERVALTQIDGELLDLVRYDDELPWDILADGFGASLERVCLEPQTDGTSANFWRASTLAAAGSFAGTPGVPRAEPTCPPPALPAPVPAFISEIHYHAVLEAAIEDEYEFVEIHNASDAVIALAGWRLAGGVEYTFPEGAMLAAGAYAVIAKKPELLGAVEGYTIPADALFGPYEGTLDNGGEKIALVSADPRGVDVVTYDDKAPWPVAADALGAGASWLSDGLLPLETHLHKGRSLERISFAAAGTEPSNWTESPLDGMTPGQANSSAGADVLPIVRDVDLVVEGSEDPLIRTDETVHVEVEFTPAIPSGAAFVEYFVEDVETTEEEVVRVALAATDDERVLAAELPGQGDNTIVRYRVVGDRGAGEEPIFPRASHPNPWRAYFVAPVTETETRIYRMYIARRNWGRLNTNISGNRVNGCAPSPTWNNREPAIFVHEGRVMDARVRFQGSRWNRGNGPGISMRVPGPQPGPLAVRSWRIALPRYRQLDGRGVITLNKLTQGCPGYNAGVGYALFAQADLPSPLIRFAQLHINGGYYHYMQEFERPGDDLLRRYNREMAEKYPDRPKENVGNLFKSVGCTCDEGPYGWGDWRRLGAFCGHDPETRYEWTYDRKTHNDWASHDALIKLIEDMHAARSDGMEAMRQFVLENFDLELVMNYIAIINWAVPFDDMFQNHFIYQRTSDGLWMLAPWDLDRNFGEWQGFNSSFFMGRQGDPSNRSGWWHRLKDTVLRAFEDEYIEHLLALNNTILHPNNVQSLIDKVSAEANQAEANAAPAGLGCGTFAGRAATFRSFALNRFELVNTRLAGVTLNAGPDQTVFAGSTVQFDASESDPDPSDTVIYRWSNGMEGERPTQVFPDAGTFEIELIVTTKNVEFRDQVVINVVPIPALAFEEKGGTVTIEAENFEANEQRDHETAMWETASEIEGFSGTGYVLGTTGRTFSTRYVGVSPELQYPIVFTETGTYRVWLRGYVASTRNDTVNVNLDGLERSTRAASDFEVNEDEYQWTGINRDDDPQLVEAGPGLHMLSLWIRENGMIVDKILLTKDLEFVPTGFGPDESGKVSPGGGEGGFVRGDANGDRKLNVTDAVTILRTLFAGVRAVECEDHGDVDDNGSLQVTDAIRLLAYLFRSGPSPAAPFPNAGRDQTPDEFACGD